METIFKPMRRVVTGNDQSGRSKVAWDGTNLNTHTFETTKGSTWTDIWVWDRSPSLLRGDNDDGNLQYSFPTPPNGGHLRVTQSQGRPPDYDPSKDDRIMPFHEPTMRPHGHTWDRGGRNAFTTDMHKTETVDYAVLLEGERTLKLDDAEITWHPGDIVVQVGAWHQWGGVKPSRVAFDMIAARFVDGPAGTAQGHDKIIQPERNLKLPEGVKPTRRVVSIDRVAGKSTLVSAGLSPDIRFDPARPGFASSRMWVTDSTPAKIVFETLHLPHTIEPPPGGSVLRVLTIPPDDRWSGKVGSKEVREFFRMMGSPGASTYSPSAPHAYMQRIHSLDLCIVQEGEIVLVLDTQEVALKQGDFAVLRGANHAWSNRSNNPVVLTIASHDGVF